MASSHDAIRENVSVLRRLSLVLALAGCVLLAIAEFSHLYEIQVITVTVKVGKVGAHHGYALLIIAIVAALMAFAAVLGGSRPAAWALFALAVAALVIALAVDLPVVNDTGLYGRNYEQAKAQAGNGFFLETLGAVVLLIAAAAILLLGAPARERARAAASSPRRS
jgi:uncharacterized membrane protein YtjA (UPF0391 family)